MILLPTLFSKNNLLKYPKKNLFWKIYTSTEQLDKLKDIKLFCKLNKINLDINTSILGSEAFEPRNNLGTSVIDCLKFSIKSNAFMIVAPPDHVFGNGLLNIIERTKPLDYTILSHPRIEYEKGTKSLGNYLKLNLKDQNNKKLMNWAMNSVPHSVVKVGLDQNFEPNHIGGLAKKSSKGFLINFKEPPPLILYPMKILLIN